MLLPICHFFLSSDSDPPTEVGREGRVVVKPEEEPGRSVVWSGPTLSCGNEAIGDEGRRRVEVKRCAVKSSLTDLERE